MPRRVEGKVALVTGGASGIGRATALTFAREGTKLIIADLDEEGGQQTVHMITEQGGEATFVHVDVTQAQAVEVLISKAVDTYGRLDCAHNNAGIGSRSRVLLHELPEESWGLCRTIAFSRQNPKIVYRKINDLRVQTFLFSVICDRVIMLHGAPRVM